MTTPYTPSKILVIEPDVKSRSVILLTLDCHFDAEFLEADTISGALELLKLHPEISCVISEYRVGDQTSAAVFQALSNEAKAGFILATHENVQQMPEFQGIGFKGYLKKPFEMDDLVLLAESKLNRSKATQHFCKINLELLKRLGKFKQDLYIKLSDNKYVKVAHENETFSEEDFQKYSKKQVDCLYLKKSDALQLVRRFTEDLRKGFLKQVGSLKSEVEASSTALEMIRNTVQEFGFEPEIQELTKLTVERTLSAIRANKTLFKLFTEMTMVPGNYLVDHSVILAHLCCGIASLQPWADEITFDQLVWASFLHDILLKNENVAMSRDYAEFVQGGFTSKEREDYLGHPEETAALVRGIYGIPPDVGNLISQHHELPDGTGFPNHVDYTAIRPLSALFIVAHDLVSFLYRGGLPKDFPQFLADLHVKNGVGHFKEIIVSLEVALSRSPLQSN